MLHSHRDALHDFITFLISYNVLKRRFLPSLYYFNWSSSCVSVARLPKFVPGINNLDYNDLHRFRPSLAPQYTGHEHLSVVRTPILWGQDLISPRISPAVSTHVALKWDPPTAELSLQNRSATWP